MNKIKEYCNILNNVFYTHTQNGVAMEEVSPSLFYLWTFEGWKWRKMGVEFLFRGGFPRGKEREIISKEIPREREENIWDFCAWISKRGRGSIYRDWEMFWEHLPPSRPLQWAAGVRCFRNISPILPICSLNFNFQLFPLFNLIFWVTVWRSLRANMVSLKRYGCLVSIGSNLT